MNNLWWRKRSRRSLPSCYYALVNLYRAAEAVVGEDGAPVVVGEDLEEI